LADCESGPAILSVCEAARGELLFTVCDGIWLGGIRPGPPCVLEHHSSRWSGRTSYQRRGDEGPTRVRGVVLARRPGCPFWLVELCEGADRHLRSTLMRERLRRGAPPRRSRARRAPQYWNW